MYKFMANHVFAPLLDVYQGTATMKCLSYLEKTQWLSPEEISHIQQQELAKLIRHAYQTVPYYNQIFKELNFGLSLVPREQRVHGPFPNITSLSIVVTTFRTPAGSSLFSGIDKYV